MALVPNKTQTAIAVPLSRWMVFFMVIPLKLRLAQQQLRCDADRKVRQAERLFA
jgi:hypothetical protein